jgi:hypothetical protein
VSADGWASKLRTMLDGGMKPNSAFPRGLEKSAMRIGALPNVNNTQFEYEKP